MCIFLYNRSHVMSYPSYNPFPKFHFTAIPINYGPPSNFFVNQFISKDRLYCGKWVGYIERGGVGDTRGWIILCMVSLGLMF